MWTSRIELAEGLRYRAIADAIRAAILEGELRPGDKLPTHRALASQMGVTAGTVSRAYAVAAEWGLVTARVGAGTVVCAPAAPEPVTPWVIGMTGDRIDFGLLRPAALTDVSLQERCFGSAFDKLGRDLLRSEFAGYSPELGHPRHREIGAWWLGSAGVNASPAEVFVCDGAQSAFLTLFSALLRPGASLLVEEFAYLGVKQLCATMRIDLVAVPMDGEGMIPERLRELAHTSGAQVVLITPTLQNPTGVRMTRARRNQIADVAREANLSIVEDATFDRLYPDAPPALVTLAPERTFHVASFSKMLQPAMRVAFVKVPEKRMPHLESIRHSLNIGGPGLQAEIVCRWIESGVAVELCQWQREAIDRRWQVAASSLPELVKSDAIPAPFVWALLGSPWKSSDLAGILRQQNVILIEDIHFAVGRSAAPHAVRISLTSPSSCEMFEEGLAMIRRVLDEGSMPVPINSFRSMWPHSGV
jgi:DNA-binding transcriptional MocR family regulator